MTLASFLIVLGLIPVIWSTGVWAVRRTTARVDAAEKRALLVMLAPVVIGVAAFSMDAMVPTLPDLPLPVIADELFWVETAKPFPEMQNRPAIALTADMLLWGLLGLYAAVTVWKAARLMASQYRLWRIARTARAREDVRLSQANIPPLALSWAVVLPLRLLKALSPDQARLVLAHERAHQHRGDTLWFPLLSWLEVIFWFNPALSVQTQRCREAAEIACDALVLRERPHMRKAYAEALLLTLKHTAGNVRQHAPAAFSTANSGEFRMRITEIMRPQSLARKSRPVWVALAALLLIPVAGAQMVWAKGPAEGKDIVMPVKGFKQLPLEGRLSSPYGPRKHPVTGRQSFHNGIDIAAAEGSAVKSVADGTVVVAGDRENYHLTVEVRHGTKTTRYTQLGSVAVKAGDKVSAGQTLGTVGNHGTGPHLHFEVWEGDKSVDPSPFF